MAEHHKGPKKHKKTKVIRRPAVPPPIRVRRNVGKLKVDDPIILWFRRAIGHMKELPIDTFNSWRFQAAIHDYVPGEDPLSPKGDPDGPNKPFWGQCEHGGWFFLPWHRIYLHHFEKIVAAHIVKLGGPHNWALPYWSYSPDPANDAKLPTPFLGEKIPNAALRDIKLDPKDDNHLWVKERHPEANNGNAFIASADQTSPVLALAETDFSQPSGNFGFGGAPVKGHSGAQRGRLERRPHDQMHGAVSGPNGDGFMGGFTTAPLDPIFWMHHCNIDRIWEVWVAKGNKNPTDKKWTDEKFRFRDVTGASNELTPGEVVNTKAKPLFYEYEELNT